MSLNIKPLQPCDHPLKEINDKNKEARVEKLDPLNLSTNSSTLLDESNVDQSSEKERISEEEKKSKKETKKSKLKEFLKRLNII